MSWILSVDVGSSGILCLCECQINIKCLGVVWVGIGTAFGGM